MSEQETQVGFDPSELSADQEILQAVGEIKYIKIKDRVYAIGACSLSDLPSLNSKVAKIQKLAEKLSDSEFMNDDRALSLMAEVMFDGTKDHNPGITKKYIKDNFGLAPFPVIFRAMLDLNEYLIGMSQIRGDVDNVELLKKK